jgi:hypothetical protein
MYLNETSIGADAPYLVHTMSIPRSRATEGATSNHDDGHDNGNDCDADNENNMHVPTTTKTFFGKQLGMKQMGTEDHTSPPSAPELLKLV